MGKNKLTLKLLGGLLIVAAVLILATGFFVTRYYKNIRLDQYKELAYSYSRTLASIVDGDKVKEYFLTGKKDEYYDAFQEYINAFVAESEDIKYAFVFVPTGVYHYIWDADTKDGHWKLGDTEQYVDGAEKVIEGAFKQNPEESSWFMKTKEYGYLLSAASPVFDSEGNPVALAGVDISADDIEREQQGFVQMIFAAIAGIILIAYLFFFIFIRRKIVKPILKIESAANSFVQNIEEAEKLNLDIHTNDEIESLANSFEKMSSEVKDYIAKVSRMTSERERISAELDVATNIQASMLPNSFPAFPERPEFDIYATMMPAKEVGGDFFDFFMVDERHVAIVCADVSGKGIPAALFMVIGKTLIKDHTTPGTDLGEVFTKVNNLLCGANKEGLFITAFEGVLDLVTGELRFVNAGHEIPFICRKGETFKPYATKHAFVLAGMEDIQYKSGSIMLEPGDKFFEYSDGVTEATDADKKLFGMDRLEESLARCSDKPVQEILPLVKKDVDEFVGDEPQFDDITMICIEYKSRMRIVV